MTPEEQKAWDELQETAANLKHDYMRACQTIAHMHAAAVGETTGPNRGVVEDVTDVRARMLAAEEALSNSLKVIQRVTSRMEDSAQHGSGSVNVRQVLNLLSPTWPDGNYEAPAPTKERP